MDLMNKTNGYIFKEGKYYLGRENKYTLTDDVLKHILSGDFSERLVTLNGRRTGKKELILKGGLHTYQGWIDFKNQIEGIEHLHFFNSKIHKMWYFARELQNGVITLKIPKEVFQNKAANLTKFPDAYYKSGYLWKTLFPKENTQENILKIIHEALLNLDEDESKDKILIGYALINDPLKAMKIRIQLQNNDIRSAFPTWEQPMTGNNGKAYSHSDTISFILSASTEYFDDRTKKNLSNKIDYNNFLESLIHITPICFRERPKITGNFKTWQHKREKKLIKITRYFNEDEVNQIKEYIFNTIIIKEGYLVQAEAYEQIFHLLKNNLEVFNTVSINLNILDTLFMMQKYDNKHKTNHFIQIVEYLLINKVIYTGGLDSWNNKVLHNKILELIIEYHNPNVFIDYLNFLSKSPSRYSLYVDFDLANICFKRQYQLGKNDEQDTLFGVINLPINNFIIDKKCFNDYITLLLSENYFMIYDEQWRKQEINRILDSFGSHYKDFIKDVVQSTNTKDFEFFEVYFNLIVKMIIDNNIQGLDSEILDLISKDYFRIQAAQRMKIFLKKQDFLLDAMDYFEYGSEEYKLHTLIKHERRVNVFNLKNFLKGAKSLAQYIGDNKLVSKIEEYNKVVWTERPPMPKIMPSFS